MRSALLFFPIIVGDFTVANQVVHPAAELAPDFRSPGGPLKLLAVFLEAALHFGKKEMGVDRPLLEVEHRPAAMDTPSTVSFPQMEDARTDVIIKLVCLRGRDAKGRVVLEELAIGLLALLRG